MKVKLIWLVVALVPLLVAVGCSGGTSDYYSEYMRNHYRFSLPPAIPLPDTIEEFCREVALQPYNPDTCFINADGEYRITRAPSELLTRENIYPPPEQKAALTREYCESSLPLNGSQTCVELPYGLLIVVGKKSELLDEYPQYPSPEETQLRIKEACELYAPIQDLIELTCIENEDGYQIIDTDSPLLDEYPEYPQPQPQLSLKEYCEWLATMPNRGFTCIEFESEYGYQIIETDSPLLDEHPQYPPPATEP